MYVAVIKQSRPVMLHMLMDKTSSSQRVMLGIVIKQLFARLQISQPCPSVSESLFWMSLKLFPFLQA